MTSKRFMVWSKQYFWAVVTAPSVAEAKAAAEDADLDWRPVDEDECNATLLTGIEEIDEHDNAIDATYQDLEKEDQ